MEVKHNDRGFEYLDTQGFGSLSQSSAIGPYDDAMEKPGSSRLWFNDEHLTREDVRWGLENGVFPSEFAPHMKAWLETGSLRLPPLDKGVCGC